MTAANNPTPEVELVERLLAAQVLEELDYEWEGKRFVTTNLKGKLKELISTQAAAIASLTAERDELAKAFKTSYELRNKNILECDQLSADNKLLSERVAVLENALDTANTALEDWLHTYAPDECNEETVKETSKRISDAGGTIAYLADVFATIRRALASREAK